MKKVLATVLCCLALLTLAVPVHAANGEDDGRPETTVGDTEYTPDEVVYVAPAALAGEETQRPPAALDIRPDAIYPIDVRYEMLGDTPYITRVYEMEEGQSPETLPKSFEQDGYTFSRMEVLKKEIPGTVDTKTASKSVVAECGKNDAAALVATLAPTTEYSQNGYTGTLQLDAASITFAENGTEGYSYRVTDTREYPGLTSNDMAAVPKTVTKNGVTLQLENVEWQITRTDPTDGGLVPTLYTAVASYSGSGRGSKVSGCMATVNYTGEVEKVTPGKVQYTLVYRGVEIVPEAPAEPEAVDNAKSGGTLFPFILLGVLVIGGLASGGYILHRRLQQKRAGANAYGYDDYEDGEDDVPEYGIYEYPEEGEPAAQTPKEPSYFDNWPDNLTGEDAGRTNLFDYNSVEDSYRE